MQHTAESLLLLIVMTTLPPLELQESANVFGKVGVSKFRCWLAL